MASSELYLDSGRGTPAPSGAAALVRRAGDVVPVPAFAPRYTYDYHIYANKTYNACIMLVRNLQVMWFIFGTAMGYVHRFLAAYPVSLDSPSELYLAVAAVFLAVKVEGINASCLGKMVTLAFEVDRAKDPEEHERYKRQVLRMEQLLLIALDFDLVHPQPLDHMFALLGKENEPGTDKHVLSLTKKLVSYSYCTPLCMRCTEREIAEGLTLMAAEAFDCTERIMQAARGRPHDKPPWTTSDATRAEIRETMLVYLVRASKRLDGFGKMDQVVGEYRRQFTGSADDPRRAQVRPRDGDT